MQDTKQIDCSSRVPFQVIQLFNQCQEETKFRDSVARLPDLISQGKTPAMDGRESCRNWGMLIANMKKGLLSCHLLRKVARLLLMTLETPRDYQLSNLWPEVLTL